jgi:hypothetical protein
MTNEIQNASDFCFFGKLMVKEIEGQRPYFLRALTLSLLKVEWEGCKDFRSSSASHGAALTIFVPDS